MRDENGRFVKGATSSFKGRKHDEEARRKQSLAHKGKPCTWNTAHSQTEETKEKIRLATIKQWQARGVIAGNRSSKEKRVGPFVRQTPEQLQAKKRFRNQRYKAVKRSALGSHTYEQWIALKEKYQNMCLCCKQFEPMIKLTQDHIVPLSMGGSDNIENIQPLCLSCNVRKHVKVISYLPMKSSSVAVT